MTDFRKLLSISADDVKATPPLPTGTYSLLVTKFEFGESAQKKTPFVRYHFTILGAQPDVDQARLAEATAVRLLAERSLEEEFYITPAALPRLKEFIQQCGVITEGRSMGDIVPEAVGRTVLGYVIEEPSQRPGDSRVFNRLSTFASA